MKNKIVICALLFGVVLLFISHSTIGQDTKTRSKAENERIDSLATAYNKQRAAEDVDRNNSKNLSDLKLEKKETKAKAREAQRVEGDANDAARESKIAYRQEKKAQKARAQADKQSKKATRARTKSDRN